MKDTNENQSISISEASIEGGYTAYLRWNGDKATGSIQFPAEPGLQNVRWFSNAGLIRSSFSNNLLTLTLDHAEWVAAGKPFTIKGYAYSGYMPTYEFTVQIYND